MTVDYLQYVANGGNCLKWMSLEIGRRIASVAVDGTSGYTGKFLATNNPELYKLLHSSDVPPRKLASLFLSNWVALGGDLTKGNAAQKLRDFLFARKREALSHQEASLIKLISTYLDVDESTVLNVLTNSVVDTSDIFRKMPPIIDAKPDREAIGIEEIGGMELGKFDIELES